MISIVFPDGRKQQYEKGVSASDVANSISTTFAKKVVLAVINGKKVDRSTEIEEDCDIKFLTLDAKDPSDKKEVLGVLRHSCAHLFAQAMRELYGDKVHFGFGPEVENGFYYDFELTDGTKITAEDFPKIEKKMHELAERDVKVEREPTTKEDAIKFFSKQGEKYKVELLGEKLNDNFLQLLYAKINDYECSKTGYVDDIFNCSKNVDILKKNIENRMKNTDNVEKFEISNYKRLYKIVEKQIGFHLEIFDWVHDWANYHITKFKINEEQYYYLFFSSLLLILFQGGGVQIDKDNQNLLNWKQKFINLLADQRITTYTQGNFTDLCRGPHVPSTGFLKYFKLMKVAGAYWRGDNKNAMVQRVYGTCWTTQKELDDYLKMLEEAEKRDHRKIGQQLDLFHLQEEAPGCVFWHPRGWTLYLLLQNYIREKIKKHGYIEVKTPQIVSKTLWEKSGHWAKYREHMFITRIDDEDMDFAIKPMNCPCHVEIFKNKIRSYRDLPIRMAEFGKCHRYEPSGSLHGLMRVRGFVQDDAHIFCTENQIASETIAFYQLLKEVYSDFGFNNIKVKFSDRPEMRVGSDELWDRAEKALREPMEKAGVQLELNKGEGAFYGPKLEFVLCDAIGREWQCGTFQVDFNLGERLGAEYVDEDGIKKAPVMLHRAVLGSFERFIAILIEHFAGVFPLWLAPVQAVVIGVNNDLDKEVVDVAKTLQDAGIRCEADLSKETVSYKVRRQSEMKIPYIITIGKREVETNTISVREFGKNQNKTMSINDFIELIKCSN